MTSGELPQPGRDPLTYDDPLEQVIRAIQRCPAPVIAMLEGSVWGGACELAFVCDILIGTAGHLLCHHPGPAGDSLQSHGYPARPQHGGHAPGPGDVLHRPAGDSRAGRPDRHPQSPGAGGGTGRISPTPWPARSPRIPPSASRSSRSSSRSWGTPCPFPPRPLSASRPCAAWSTTARIIWKGKRPFWRSGRRCSRGNKVFWLPVFGRWRDYE